MSSTHHPAGLAVIPVLRSFLFGAVNFAVAIMAVSYMFLGTRSTPTGVLIIACLSLFGAASNYLMARMVFKFIDRVHQRAVRREKDAVARELCRGRARLRLLRQDETGALLRRMDLAEVPSHPIQGGWRLLAPLALAGLPNAGLILNGLYLVADGVLR